MTILLQSHARQLITREFDSWARRFPRQGGYTEADGLLFFQYMQNKKTELLAFRFPGHDQWPDIRAWLVSDGLILDKTA